MKPFHKWTFKTHFRRGAYGWKGTRLASKRLREAVGEIRKVEKTDPALAGEGWIVLCKWRRLLPDFPDSRLFLLRLTADLRRGDFSLTRSRPNPPFHNRNCLRSE